MGILDQLKKEETWETYFIYKTEKQHLSRKEAEALRSFIDEKAWLPVINRLENGTGFSVPELKKIRKSGTEKKRTVFLFPPEENYVLKLMTWLLERQYDSLFSEDLYSFRVGQSAGKAVRKLIRVPGIRERYVYKADISDYFNSIPVPGLLPLMEKAFSDEPACLKLLTDILTDRRVLDEGTVREMDKGVMAGSPFSVFLANLYLDPLDKEMEKHPVIYARYSDDIILFAETEEQRDREAAFIEKTIQEAGLLLNPGKVVRTGPGEKWSFLGFSYENGAVDISPVSLKKIKDRIRRRARAIKRWQIRKGATDEQAVKGLIRAMNRKFFAADNENDLTWCRWYFPLITTDTSLHEIDACLQYWIRAVYSGHHRKKNYELPYERLKDWGYESLVHAWYLFKKGKELPSV